MDIYCRFISHIHAEKHETFRGMKNIYIFKITIENLKRAIEIRKI